SLDSYELPRDQEQIGMLSNLVDNIHNNNIKRKREESDANIIDNTKKNKGFSAAKG
ncbi:7163_t:CDS:2, partial [Funneliformis caledonium]